MAKLGIPPGRAEENPTLKRQNPGQNVRPKRCWALSDASIKSIATRTGHSVKSVRAKIARLDYEMDEIHGFTVFTADTLAALLNVTPRQVRRWKERGWLETKDRRITAECLKRFLRARPDLVSFDSLPRKDQVF